MKIQKAKLSEVKLNPNNPRLIKDDKFKKLVQSIKDFPEMLNIRPIVVNQDMVILGGNMRYKACKEAGLKEIPIIIADLTEDQQREFLIKDNVSGGEWDWEVLANEWDSEQLEDWGLDVPSFEVDEVLEAEEDDFDTTPPEIPITVLGDLYEIGEHRLLCGDSTCSDTVAKLMDGNKADMVFTDPPYNVDYGANDNPRHKQRTIKNDKMGVDDWNQFVIGYMNSIFQMTDGNIYISMSDKELGHMQSTFRECGGKWASFIVWVKDRLVLSPKDYHSRHETILYGWKEGVKDRLRVLDRTQDDVWEIKRPGNSEEHHTN